MSTPDYDTLKAERRNPSRQAARREAERAEAELACRTRGHAYVSRSRRRFRAVIAAEPERDGKHVDGAQLLLALCDLHEKPARRRGDRSREVVLGELERRGESTLELAEPVPKRASVAWLVYESIGGEVLETELRGLTAAEARHVRHVSLNRAATRQVTWPSQSTAPIRRVNHDSDANEIA